MKSAPKKRGRPTKPYRSSWGETIDGLRYDLKTKRWHIKGGPRYREPDERLAVARFRAWQAEQADQTTPLTASVLNPNMPFNTVDLRTGKPNLAKRSTAVNEADIWAYVRQQLIDRPEWVAEQVGIEEVARLADLPKPQPSPTLKELGKLYVEKSGATKHYVAKIRLAWGDFTKAMSKQGITTAKQLTPAAVAEHADELKASDFSPKYIKHKMANIRGVFNFAQKRGVYPKDISHAINCCKVLTAPKQNGNKNPNPISVEDYQALLSHATEPRMRAMLLTMLNLCMYPSEALNLDWGEVDLKKKTVVTDRNKTAVIRIGVLWEDTIEALRAIRPKKPDPKMPIFLSAEGNRWHIDTYRRQFNRLRKAAGVSSKIKSESMRDGAYTAAVESGADLTQAKLLAGHTTGISDYYAKRRPTMVEPAIEAIRAAYF